MYTALLLIINFVFLPMLLSHWQVKHMELKCVEGCNLAKEHKIYKECIKIAFSELRFQFYNVLFVLYTICSA
jgi:hypothetical protein